MSRTTTTLAALAAGAILLAGCELEDEAVGFGGLDQAAEQPQLPSTADQDAELLAELRVEPELDDSDYDRDDWNHWTSIDGCDTRSRVLQEESEASGNLQVNDNCTVTSGQWRDPFEGEHPMDGTVLTDPSEVDIDHVVPLAEAHRSGGAEWDEHQKEDYANSTDFVLAPVAASANRTKGDSDPTEWRPDNECLYAGYWIQIKTDWDLTIDDAERAALVDMLGTCPDR